MKNSITSDYAIEQERDRRNKIIEKKKNEPIYKYSCDFCGEPLQEPVQIGTGNFVNSALHSCGLCGDENGMPKLF